MERIYGDHQIQPTEAEKDDVVPLFFGVFLPIKLGDFVIVILLMRTLRARSSELTTHCDSTPHWLLPDPIYSILIYVPTMISYFPCLGEISVTFNSS